MTFGEIILRLLKVASVGVSLGALAAAPALFGVSAADLGRVAGWLAWAVAVVPSLVLLVMAMNDRQDDNVAAYTGGARSYVTVMLIGVLGAMLAFAAFYTLATAAPPMLGGLDASAVRKSVDAAASWQMMVPVAAAAALGALAVTAWVDRSAGE